MATITTKDGTTIFYKDWGTGQPIVFSHGWPLSADDWDGQMLYFGQKGFRVIAHDRRGHGRSGQTWSGNDMDTYADDLATLIEELDLRDATRRRFHRRRRSGPLYRARHRARRQGGAGRRHPADDAEDGGIREARPSKCSTACARRGREPAEFYRDITMPFTDTTAPARRFPKASGSTGGCRAWWEASRHTTTASEFSRRQIRRKT